MNVREYRDELKMKLEKISDSDPDLEIKDLRSMFILIYKKRIHFSLKMKENRRLELKLYYPLEFADQPEPLDFDELEDNLKHILDFSFVKCKISSIRV